MSDLNSIDNLLSRCAAIPQRIAQAVEGRNEEELHASLRLFTLRRAELVNTLCSLALEDWQRIGIHEEWGPMTLLAILTLFLEHEEEHCAQIVAINNAF